MNLRSPKEYCENLLWIRTKKQTMARLRFNDAQNNLYGGIRRLGSKLTKEYADFFEPENVK